MQKSYHKFLQAAVIFPSLMTHLALSPITGAAGAPTAAAIFPEQTRTLTSEASVNQQLSPDEKVSAAKLDAFFDKYNLPMEGYGEKLVSAAVKNGLDDYDVALIALEESTGCKFIIPNTNNCFGWGGGKIRFNSMNEAIDTVAENISGNDPDTAKYYKGKPMDQVLKIYNGNVNHHYLSDIRWLKAQIEQQDVQLAATPVVKV